MSTQSCLLAASLATMSFWLLNAERDALMGTGPSTLPGAVSGDAAVVEVGQADGT